MVLKKVKILHAPDNIAGQPAMISRAQRALGFKSDVLVYDHSSFGYEDDICLDINKKTFSYLKTPLILLGNLLRCLKNYDVFHFHFGQTLLPYDLDLPILRFFGKKIVMQYWGSDVMQTDIAKKYTLFSDQDFIKIFGEVDNQKKRKNLKKIAKITNCTIVGDYSLLPYSPKSEVVRQAIDYEKIPFVGAISKHKKATIVHAPSNRKIKGTEYVLKAIQKLKRERYPINFILVEKTPHQKAMEIYKKADIVIDDLLQGPYGILAIECMALGKPVLGRIDPKLIHYYKNLPIVVTTPDTVYENLVKLIKNPKLREKLGVQGRKYVESNHNAEDIARQLIKIYQKI